AGRVGRKEDALAMHRKILDDRQALAARTKAGEGADPDVIELQNDVAASHHVIADLYRDMGKLPEPLAAQQAKLTICRRLAEAQPDRPLWRRDVAATLGNMANLKTDAGKVPEALSDQQAGRAVFAGLVKAHPDDTSFQRDLAISDLLIGEALRAV